MDYTCSAKFFNGIDKDGVEVKVRCYATWMDIEYPGNRVKWDFKDIERIDVFKDIAPIITHKGTPVQTLMPESTELIDIILTSDESKGIVVKNERKASRGGMAKLLVIAVVILAIALLGYIYGLPWLAAKMAEKVPEEYEKTIGESLYKADMAKYTIDIEKTRLSQEFFDSLHISGNKQVKITVVKSGQVNAYAMPGGYIVVYDSIIGLLNSPESYAALLAHEYSHVKFRHSLRVMARQLAGSIFIGLITGDANSTAATLASNADALKGLQYSRELEMEADMEAVRLLQQSGVNPNGMLELFEGLKKTAGSDGVSEFVSTHPLFNTRIEYIAAKLKKDQKEYEPDHAIKDVFLRLKKSK